MINFVPGYKEDYDEMIKSNPLYNEILERRSYFDCKTCDYYGLGTDKCNVCLHTMKYDNIELRDFVDRKLKVPEKVKIKRGLFGCSCNNGWTGLVSMYFQRDNKFLSGESYANFCPLCGKEHISKEK